MSLSHTKSPQLGHDDDDKAAERMNVCVIRRVSKPHLHLHAQVVDEVSRERQAVDWSQYCIDPTWGSKKRIQWW